MKFLLILLAWSWLALGGQAHAQTFSSGDFSLKVRAQEGGIGIIVNIDSRVVQDPPLVLEILDEQQRVVAAWNGEGQWFVKGLRPGKHWVLVWTAKGKETFPVFLE